jgi:N-methylhydantoinase A
VYFPAPIGRVKTPVWQRANLGRGQEIHGPAVIEEYSATTVLLPGDIARVGELGELVIRCTDRPEAA